MSCLNTIYLLAMKKKQKKWHLSNFAGTRQTGWCGELPGSPALRCVAEAGQRIAYVLDIVNCEEKPEAPRSALINNSEVNARVKERRKTPLDITAQVKRKGADSQPFWQTAKIWLLWLRQILLLRGRRSLSLLLPYYLHDGFAVIFRDIGFEVFWAGNREDTEKIIMENEPDLAIEWQHGPDDFPIRDLLRRYGRWTPVILALNWNGSLPDDTKEIGCVGCVNVPWNLRELMDLFYKALPDRKKRVLRKYPAARVELKRKWS